MGIRRSDPADIWTMRCDGDVGHADGSPCGVPGPSGSSFGQVVNEAIVCGWEFVHAAALCPQCSECGRNFVPVADDDASRSNVVGLGDRVVVNLSDHMPGAVSDPLAVAGGVARIVGGGHLWN